MNVGGHYNVSAIYRSLYRLTTGKHNVSLGAYSGSNITDGSYNIALGYDAGDSITTGDYNICIGKGSCSSSVASTVSGRFDNFSKFDPTASYQFSIANIITGKGNSTSMSTTNTSNSVLVKGVMWVTNSVHTGNNTISTEGSISARGNIIYGGSLSNLSDIRLKNITGDNHSGLKEINQIQVKNFTYKNDEKKIPHVGVIAQELQKIFPNSVFKDDKGYLSISQNEIFWAMVNSIKELCAKILGLDKRITALEEENARLKQQIEKQNLEFEKRLSKLEKKAD